MRFIELIGEARHNPHKNPKTSINQHVADAIIDAPGSVAGTPNAFVSFTKVDKLGIYPRSDYATPLGIYSYPAEYVTVETGASLPMSTLPYVGDSPYANIFNVSGNIINIATISDAEVKQYYQQMLRMAIRTANNGQDTLKNIISDAPKNARYKTPGGMFWYVTMRAVNVLYGKGKHAVKWNKLFRELGIDGFVDIDRSLPAYGRSIIHPNEPCQSVFFSLPVIKNNKRYYNKYSPESIRLTAAVGSAKDEEIKNAVQQIRNAAGDFQEIYEYLYWRNFMFLGLVKDPKIRLRILQKSPEAIENLRNPSQQEKYIVLVSDFHLLPKIQNLSKADTEIVTMALQHPNNKNLPVSAYMPLFYRKHLFSELLADREFQLEFVKKHPDYNIFEELTHPDTIRAILQKNTKNPPRWALRAAKRLGVNPFEYISIYDFPGVADVRKQIDALNYDLVNLEKAMIDLGKSAPDDDFETQLTRRDYQESINMLTNKIMILSQKAKEEIVRIKAEFDVK